MNGRFFKQWGPWGLIVVLLVGGVWVQCGLAVTSKIVRYSSSADLLKGKTDQVMIDSRGTIRLGRGSQVLVEQFPDVWAVNSIVVSGGTVYVGTSPNGGIYKYSLGKLTRLYPRTNSAEVGDANDGGQGQVVDSNAVLTNEHIFALATDVSGRLLAGISGTKARLCRFEGEQMEVVFEPNDAQYIFAIAVDAAGNIYLGTGPEGKIYKTDAFGENPQLLYDAPDKNILSLAAGKDNVLYAGTDGRGLVYRIDTRSKKATVIYDSEQPEITALFFDAQGRLWAAATSARVVQTQRQFAAQQPSAGRPETKVGPSRQSSSGGLQLKIANTGSGSAAKAGARPMPVTKGAKPGQVSHVYRISEEGFVTDVFAESAVFFCLVGQQEQLILGTGNNAQVFTIDPETEEKAVVYEDKQAVQVTAAAVAGDEVYLGTANPAKLVRLAKTYASKGTYISPLVDAGQPARWGKLQIDADIPKGCKVLVASRSGNVKDVNDPSFSQWTEPVEITEPVQLRCPMGRFCQYKLMLQSDSGQKTPVIREVAVASTVPNLAPKVESVTVSRVEGPGKAGLFKITYKANDVNGDKLIYSIDFRKVGRTRWIRLKDKLEANSFEWDSKTVEDGRYEIRVVASDERSNTSATKLQGSRISEPVVVDNTGPQIESFKSRMVLNSEGPHRVFEFKVSDALSAIGKFEYTLDSNADWIATVPDDQVYDTMSEHFTIYLDMEQELTKGDHVLAVKVSDAVGNTTYKSYELTID